MSKGEKRCFKMLASSMEAKSVAYIELFEAIEKMKQYDEAALKKKLARKSWIRNFASTKNYLYTVLLKALRVANSDKSKQDKIRNHRQNFRLLTDRGLHELAIEELGKARLIAENKMYSETEVLAVLEDRLNRNVLEQYFDKEACKVEAMIMETVEASEKHHLYIQHLAVVQKMHYLMRHGNLRSSKTLSALKQLLADPVLQVQGQQSPRIQLIRSELFLDTSAALGNYREAANVAIRLQDLIEHDAFQENVSRFRIPCTSKILHFLMYVGSPSELDKYLQQYNDLLRPILARNPVSSAMKRKAQMAAYGLRLHWLMNMHMLKELAEFLPEAEALMQRSISDASPREFRLDCHEFSRAYWLLNKLDKSREYMDKLLLHQSTKTASPRTEAPVKLLEVILLYCEQEYDYLSYRIKNLSETLKRKESYYPFEQAFFSMMRQLISPSKQNRKEQILNDFHKKFLSLLDQPTERSAFLDTDVLFFIERRLGWYSDGSKKPKTVLNQMVSIE